jgi:hypothetical protein
MVPPSPSGGAIIQDPSCAGGDAIDRGEAGVDVAVVGLRVDAVRDEVVVAATRPS